MHYCWPQIPARKFFLVDLLYLEFLIASLVIACASPAFAQLPMVVVLKSGSVIKVEANVTPIPWQPITDSAVAANQGVQSIKLADIDSLFLSSTSISEHMQEVATWLAELDSQDYSVRENAEKNLRISPSLKTFKSLTDEYQKHDSLELRYRLNRLLRNQETSVNQAQYGAEHKDYFDQLVMSNGQKLRGDATELILAARWRGQSVDFPKGQLEALIRSEVWNRSVRDEADFSAQVSTRLQSKFEQNVGTQIDFQKNGHDVELEVYTTIDNAFVDYGARLSSVDNRKVIISGFPFVDFGTPTGGNSVCVYEASDPNRRRFEGVMNFDFCVPGASSYSAGVRRVGFFAARIDQPKDFVMEAFDANGHLLGTVESDGNPCAFFGIESSTPIVSVSFHTNSYFFPKAWQKDTRYAVDSLSFDGLKEVVSLKNSSDRDFVYLKSGELLCAEAIEFSGLENLGVRMEFGERLNIPLNEVSGIVWRQAKPHAPRPGSKTWMCQLDDGSVLAIDPKGDVTSPRMTDWVIPRTNVNALWCDRDYMRMPIEGDFVDGKNMLVFPSCRVVVPSVDWGQEQVSWDASSARVFEPTFADIDIVREKVKLEQAASLPTYSKVNFDEFLETQSPTMWFKAPQDFSRTAMVSTRSGEHFAIGPECRFRLTAFEQDHLVLSGPNNASLQIRYEEILRVRF